MAWISVITNSNAWTPSGSSYSRRVYSRLWYQVTETATTYKIDVYGEGMIYNDNLSETINGELTLAGASGSPVTGSHTYTYVSGGTNHTDVYQALCKTASAPLTITITKTSAVQTKTVTMKVTRKGNTSYTTTSSWTFAIPPTNTFSGQGNALSYTQSSYTFNWCTYVTYKVTSTTETAVNYTATVGIFHNNSDTSKHVSLATGITATLSVGGSQVSTYTSTAAHETYAGAANIWTLITYNGSIARTTAAQTKAISATITLKNWGSGTSTYTNNSALSIPAKNKYTLTFNANGHGTAPTAQSVYYGTTATQPTNPTATGWTFGGWYNEAACTSAFSFSTTITANKTIYAKWTAQTSTVTLNANGGSGGTASVTATYDSAMPSMTKPTLSGWTFQGYYDTSAASGGTQYYTSAGASARTWNKTGAQTLYARWSRTITFKHGKANASSGTTTQYKGGNITPPTITAVSGWTAIGWRDDTSAGAKEYGANNTTAFAYTGTAATLYATYSRTLTISYANGGGTGTNPSNTTTTQYYNANGAITSPAVTLATNPYSRTGYSFNVWNVSTSNTNVASGGSYTWSIAVDVTTISRTATAQWTINSYTLTIDPNGGSWGGTTSVSTASQNYNTTKSIAVPTRAGYTFVGWAETGNGRLSKINQADPAFDSSSGGVGVYNNSGGGTVTHTRQSSSAGTAYGSYEILISSSSGTTSPGNGGFVQTTTSAASQKYIHVFVAKIPVGYTVQQACNATGDGRTIQWLTSRKGTGAYQVYAYQHNCGSSGTFSTFGHVYLDTGSRPVSWQLAYSAMTNITNGFADTYTYGAGAGRLTALWAPIVPMRANINGTWKTGPVWLNINGTWKQALEGYVNVNGTWKQIK